MSEPQLKYAFASTIVALGWASAYKMLCEKSLSGDPVTEMMLEEIEKKAIIEALAIAYDLKGITPGDISFQDAHDHAVDLLQKGFSEYRGTRQSLGRPIPK